MGFICCFLEREMRYLLCILASCKLPQKWYNTADFELVKGKGEVIL